MLADNTFNREYIDLSHILYDRMPGFTLKRNNKTVEYSIRVKPFLTHRQSLPFFNNNCAFEITEVSFQTSIGTYLDSPYHRYQDMRDISQLKLKELILDGLVIQVQGQNNEIPLGPECLPEDIDLNGKAVLFCFGWSKYWGTKEYFQHPYPYLDKNVIERLVRANVKLVGVDTPNIDNPKDLFRPAHSLFLANNILIVENLTNLELLVSRKFIFFAIPVKIRNAAAMPVSAFAEVFP